MAEKAVPMPNEKLVRVFDTEQEAEALVVRSLLESAGIDCQIGEAENVDVLPVGGVAVLVREEDAATARQVLEDYRRSPDQEQAEEEDFEQSAIEAASEPGASEDRESEG